jgi:hypothetical protein
VLGVSDSGAAVCATTGRGRQACVIKWAHGATEALEFGFDLHKDSLPTLGTATLRLDAVLGSGRLQLPVASLPAEACSRLAEVLGIGNE